MDSDANIAFSLLETINRSVARFREVGYRCYLSNQNRKWNRSQVINGSETRPIIGWGVALVPFQDDHHQLLAGIDLYFLNGKPWKLDGCIDIEHLDDPENTELWRKIEEDSALSDLLVILAKTTDEILTELKRLVDEENAKLR